MSLFFTGSVHSISELKDIYAKLLPELRPQTLILLSGEVGSGKTTSVQQFLDLLGFEPKSGSSPSFAIHHRYENSHSHLSLDHVDLYRLRDEEDLESTGFWDLFSQKKACVLVEWADRIREDSWPLHWRQIKIHLTATTPTDREVRIEIIDSI